MLIRSASWFEVCQVCNQHGRIVLPTGLRRKEVCSQQRALEDMMSARTEHLLLLEELEMLRWLIIVSGIPKLEIHALKLDVRVVHPELVFH